MNTSTPRFTRLLTSLALGLALLVPVAARAGSHDHGHESGPLVAVLKPTAGNTAAGVVVFEAVEGGAVKVSVTMSGLKPLSSHAIHIHEFGDVRASDGKSAGGHYNPEGHDHALPEKAVRHAGDLGNLKADSKGNAYYTLTVHNVSLNGEKNPILGRGVIVHAGEDDGGQPTGNAGGRIASGVIGIMNPGWHE